MGYESIFRADVSIQALIWLQLPSGGLNEKGLRTSRACTTLKPEANAVEQDVLSCQAAKSDDSLSCVV